MSEHELPPDPDEDALPPEIAEAEGPLYVEGIDEDGNCWIGPVTKDDLAAAFADRRRVVEADDAA